MSSDNSGFRAVNIPPHNQITVSSGEGRASGRRRKRRAVGHAFTGPGRQIVKLALNREGSFRKSNRKNSNTAR